MMLLQYFCLILLYFFVRNCYAENVVNENFNTASINNVRMKKHLDLEVYSNFGDIVGVNILQRHIPNVCDRENKSGRCRCSDNRVSCVNQEGLIDLNVKALMENFTVKNVYILFCKFTQLGKGEIFPLNEKTIESLTIDQTEIQHIDDGAFDGLTSIRILELESTNLSVINENILTPIIGATLQKLKLNDIKLSSFNPSIFKYLINLVELHFTESDFGGKIENQFPKSLSKLKILNLERCKMIYLGDNIFENLRNLEQLRLGYNNFTSIPAAINKLSNLKTMSFGGNHLRVLEKNSFEENPKLKNIFLVYSSKLKSVEDCAFCGLPNLKVVDLNYCEKLTHIHENAFGAISNGYSPEIAKFSIDDCKISVLPEKLLNWKKIVKLSINRNLFACNCSMAWLFNDLLSENSVLEHRLIPEDDYSEDIHLRYNLGCLDPSKNETHSMIEIFASCPTSSNDAYFRFLLILLFVVGVCFVVLIYANRVHLINFYRDFISNQ